MKRSAYASIFIVLALSACNKDKPAASTSALDSLSMPASSPAMTSALPPGHPTMTPSTSPTGQGATPGMAAPGMGLPSLPSINQSPNQNYEISQSAKVVSFIDIPEFTYIEVQQNGTTRWLASRTITVHKGDTVKFDNGSTMENFNSKKLNRTFPSLTFINKIVVTKG